MSNGRSFTRNRKGSPAKSKRKAQQRQAANWKFQAAIDKAGKSAVEAAAGALDDLASQLAEVTVVPEDEARELLEETQEAFADATDD